MILRHVRQSDFAPGTRVIHRATRAEARVKRPLKTGRLIVVSNGRMERWSLDECLKLPTHKPSTDAEIDEAIRLGLTICELRHQKARCV